MRASEARRLLDRYMVEVVERYGLCPWAAPARARGQVKIEIVEVSEVAAAVDRFINDAGAVVGLVVLPSFDGDASALRRVRDVMLAERGGRIAVADFHPRAPLDLGDAYRLVPFLRRSPDAMLQAVRHETLAGLRGRASGPWSANEQAAALAGLPVARPRDPLDEIALENHRTVRAQTEAIVQALEDIARDRDASYARLAVPTATRRA